MASGSTPQAIIDYLFIFLLIIPLEFFYIILIWTSANGDKKAIGFLQ